MMNTKIREVLPDPLKHPNDGLFQFLAKKEKLSFLSQEDAFDLDIDYYFGHSGDKTVSPLVDKLLSRSEGGYPIKTGYTRHADLVDDDGHYVTDGDGNRLWVDYESTLDLVKKLADIIYLRFGDAWKRSYEALEATYSPISDYEMSETETVTGEGTSKESGTASATDSREGSSTSHDERSGTASSSATGKGTSSLTEDSASSSTSMGTSSTSGSSSSEGTSSEEGTSSSNEEDDEKNSSKITTVNQSDASTYGFNSADAVPTDSAAAQSTVSGDLDDNEKKTSKTLEGKTSSSSTSTSKGSSSSTGEISSENSSTGKKTSSGENSSESSSSDSSSLTADSTGTSSSSGKSDSSTSKEGSTTDKTERTRSVIGVNSRTIQELIQQELNLRKQDLFAMMYGDVDKILTISIY